MDPTKVTPEPVDQAPPVTELPDLRTAQERVKDAADAAAWLTDPTNKQKALLLAQQVQAVMGKNWFNLRAFTKRIGESREAAFTKLSLLGQFGLLAKRGEGAETRYRVILSIEDRVAVLRLFETEHQHQLQAIRHELAKLERERSSGPLVEKVQERGESRRVMTPSEPIEPVNLPD